MSKKWGFQVQCSTFLKNANHSLSMKHKKLIFSLFLKIVIVSGFPFKKGSNHLTLERSITSIGQPDDDMLRLKKLRIKNPNKIIIAHLNINSITKTRLFHGVIDILIIYKTKTDDSFPTEQFIIEVYSTICRLDRNGRCGGIMLIAKDNLLTSRLDKFCFPDEIEIFCVELNLRKKKWLIFCCYNPHKHHLFQIESAINYYSKTYKNLITFCDFNVEISDFSMEFFCVINNLKWIIKEPTCYKIPNNPTCINLILTNCPKNFQESSTLETWLSDFHKMVLTEFKSEAPKLTPRVVSYRKYKHFDRDKFKLEVFDKLSMQDPWTMDYKNFEDTIIDSLNKYAPLKRKYLRANHSNFITKELSKAIMQRSKLRNLYLKVRSDENRIRYKKERNICVSLRLWMTISLTLFRILV